ncbi:hypothetical protein H0H92_005533 [Tricholoma furcatifolium]|nr:hypothetical protein H0H92_005533 [Tricholoma furcatifolium]
MSQAEEPTPKMSAIGFISGGGAHELICDQCISISTTPSGAHLLHFADGSTHEADLVIGADGTKSTVREFVTGSRRSHVAYSNSVAYRALIPAETLRNAGIKTNLTEKLLCWIGKDQEEILSEHSGWGDDAKIIFEEMKIQAHAMLPHLGAGVGQGFEDVYAALKAYDHARVERVNMVQQRSAKAGDIYEGRGVGGATILQIREQIANRWEPIWHYNLEEVVKRALKDVYGNEGL